jgi:hypothetical protein
VACFIALGRELALICSRPARSSFLSGYKNKVVIRALLSRGSMVRSSMGMK